MPYKLLLADDSITIQRVIELTFADENVVVVTAGDGKQAIERIERERPDIVLADVGMPERDGYEVAAFVKSHPALGHVPVLLLAGAFEPVDEPRARAIGCAGVLVKPFEPQVVITRVKGLLAGGQPATSDEVASRAAAPVERAPVEDLAPAPAEHNIRPAGGDEHSEAVQNYFDRIDAAMSEIDAAGESQRSRLVGDLERGPRDPAGPVPEPAIEETDRDGRRAPPEPTEQNASVGSPLQSTALASAFATLLAAEEEGVPVASEAEVLASRMVSKDELVEEVTRRILERMSDRAVREVVGDIVLQVAERLVREEIERIKQAAG